MSGQQKIVGHKKALKYISVYFKDLQRQLYLGAYLYSSGYIQKILIIQVRNFQKATFQNFAEMVNETFWKINLLDKIALREHIQILFMMVFGQTIRLSCLKSIARKKGKPSQVVIFPCFSPILCNTLNWGNRNSGFVKLVVRWAERICSHISLFFIWSILFTNLETINSVFYFPAKCILKNPWKFAFLLKTSC